MSDLRALTDAFAELERRADAATAGMPFELPSRARPRRAPLPRLVPVVAAVAVVAGLATGAVLLVPDGPPATQTAAPPAASSTTLSTVTSEPPPPVPANPDELAERFRAVLGDTATFVVTETGPGAVVMTAPPAPPAVPRVTNAPQPTVAVGASITGTLTASGVTGGFDLAVYPGTAGKKAECNAPDPATMCTARDLPDGSSLATGQVPLEAANGMTYEVKLIRPDGVVFTMHLSNQRSPKGSGEQLAPQPPLTIDQLIAIATSDRW
ncbi:hypothetical protein [Saccharothrix deserti]|uniref:hypothetical protein n=1 Tax=Saccharothrix deserti TaxID=2593674 RepID=UPI00131AEEC1|nr:hypothetical protein [Saccharothrix deserti]